MIELALALAFQGSIVSRDGRRSNSRTRYLTRMMISTAGVEFYYNANSNNNNNNSNSNNNNNYYFADPSSGGARGG